MRNRTLDRYFCVREYFAYNVVQTPRGLLHYYKKDERNAATELSPIGWQHTKIRGARGSMQTRQKWY